MAAEVLDGRGQGPLRRVLRPVVARALDAPPGPELLTGLLSLSGRDDLTARESVEVTVAWQRMVSFCTAGQLGGVRDVDRALAGDVAGGRPAPGRTDSVRPAADELAPALGISPRAASTLVVLARRVEAMPAAADALADGRMDLARLRVTERVTRDLPAGTAHDLETAAVRWAGRRTAQQLEGDLAAEAARLDPAHAVRAAARGVAERDVTLRRSPLPGCRRLVADLPLTQACAAALALGRAAKNARRTGLRADGTREDRTLAQLRADLLSSVLTGRADPSTGRVPAPDDLAALAEVQVVVAADTLAGTSDLPAHVPGAGPLDAATVRDLARRAPWRRLVADPTTGTLLQRGDRLHPPGGVLAPAECGRLPAPMPGEPPGSGAALDVADPGPDPRLAAVATAPLEAPAAGVDPTRYRPTRRLRRHVHTRDATCVGPACSHPATGTQLDHTIAYGTRDPEGRPGVTTAANLGSLCDRVHNAKTHGGWDLAQPAPGEFVWTSPTGRTYRVAARPLLPAWHAHPARSPGSRDGPRPPPAGP